MESDAKIHPTAIIDPEAKLGEGASVGAYAIVRGPVRVGTGTVIHEHTVLGGPTIIGRNCKIGPAAYIGLDPQHLRFIADPQKPTYLVIGDNVIIRESARIHRSTVPGEDHATRIGDNCFIMGAVHVGHDCVLDANVTLADAVLLGGHCHIGQRTFLGGGCTIHQFVRIGRLAIVAGNEALAREVPPFAAVLFGRLKGYNAIGCKRSGMDLPTLKAIRAVFQRLRRHRTTAAALEAIGRDVPDLPEIREILGFIATSRRGILASHLSRAGTSRFDGDDGGHDESDSPRGTVDRELRHR